MSEARKIFKNVIRRKRYAFDKSKTEKLITSKSSNIKEYWRLLKKAANIQTGSSVSASRFSEYFRAINNPDDHFYQADEDIIFFNERYLNGEYQVMFNELNVEISYEEIKKAVKQLRNGASAGPDLYINEFFKNGTDIMINYIYMLFNKIFELGYFPEKWSEGYIIPIFKKGDTNEPSNYRGITLLSTLGKLFTRILNNRLNDWAENYNIYIEAQAGFRKNMSTTDNVFVINSLITHVLNSNEKLYCAFVDFTKAFDFVVRDILWYKLIKQGVRGKMLDIMMSMYSIVKSQVKHNSTISDAFISNIGVRQGECLSPFLFSIYLNDLEEEITSNGANGVDIGMMKLFLLLYADDIVLFANTPDELQHLLDILKDYCARNRLTVNTSKTKVVIFRKGGRIPTDLTFKYYGDVIEIVSKFSYLGIVFTSGGSCHETQKTLAGQSLKAIFAMNKYLHKFTYLKPSHVLDVFDKLITPILNYGSEVWGFHKAPAIESVHTHFCKKLLGVKQSTQNDFIYGELGRVNFAANRYISIVRYWLKIVSLTENKYVKCIYNMLLEDIRQNPNKTNWASSVRDLLSTYGFFNVWVSQGVENPNSFLQCFKQKIRDVFEQDWHARLENSTRARFYINIANFKYQAYLDNLTIAKFQQNLTRLRVSAHRLEVECGRWTRPERTPLDERKCKICHRLEDEFHFVLECPLYAELRKQFISKFYWKRPNMPKFVELCKSENKKIQKNLSMFIEKKSVHKQYIFDRWCLYQTYSELGIYPLFSDKQLSLYVSLFLHHRLKSVVLR